MQKQDDSQQSAELRQAFLRHLPKRLDTLTRRGMRQALEGWDINTLSLLFREVQTLSGACGRYGLLDLAEKLFAIESSLAGFVERVALPDDDTTPRIAGLLSELRDLAIAHAAATPTASAPIAVAQEDLDRSENGYPLQLVPPAEYWKRFVDTAPVSNVVPLRAATPATATANAAVESAPVVATPAPAPAPARAPTPAAAAPNAKPVRKVYHLTDGEPLACEIDQKLEASGYELSLLDNIDELVEMIGALPPHVIVVDARFVDQLDRVSELLKAARARVSHRVAMLALSAAGDLDVRLRAMRCGADAFITLPTQAADVLARIAELTEVESTDPFRVLIVEDDRSQAIFAESILRKAGMQTNMVTNPLAVLEELDLFKPDLILMDLYMPGCDGMELTSIIREREAFISTPIVFLSGEHDTEKHFEALNAGGDDFLSKPIRPKHLISAVNNRLRRARHIQRRAMNQNPRDPATGMYDRAYVLDRINAKLAGDEQVAHRGGVMFVELDDAAPVREQIGLIGFDHLLGQVGAFIAGHVETSELVARLGDASFLVFSPELGAEELRQQATNLRDRTTRELFDIGGRQLHASLGFGICPFALGLGDAGTMLNAAERAMVEARKPGAGHVGLFRVKPTGDAAIVETIRAALRNDAFQLLFQPIAALQGENEGAEEEQFQVLLRMLTDGGKLMTAAEVLPHAEGAGLIDDIDRWVLGRCLLVLSERARLGRPVRLFVSQSLNAMRDPSRLPWLRQQLETRRIGGERLVVDLRFEGDVSTLDSLVGFAAAIKQLGAAVCLAGMEARDADFTAIERVPSDFVKLTPRYLSDRGAGTRDEMRRLVHFAHERGKRVIAPQIEDAQSAALLWTVGVDYIQGNFVQHAAQELDYDFRAAAS